MAYTFMPTTIIQKKRDGRELSAAEIQAFIAGLGSGQVADYQAAAFLMAVYLQGMTPAETAALTTAMLNSGRTFKFSPAWMPGVVDKHSTGGIGDKASLVLAPIAAAAGIKVPMIAGRGLGHTGGTIDKLESIPGFKVNFSPAQALKLLRQHQLFILAQTPDLAPADKKLYALRDVTGTVESIPLITASIMSKKLAEGISGLVMDVKTGSGAFMPSRAKAQALADSLAQTAVRCHKNIITYLTDMGQPLGHAVGNTLEILEVIATLRGQGPKDLVKLSCELAAGMIQLGTPKLTYRQALRQAQEILRSGKAWAKFREMVKAQGGDVKYLDHPGRFKLGRRLDMKAPHRGYVTSFDGHQIGMLAVKLGAGRQNLQDQIHPEVGFVFPHKIGDFVEKGQTLFQIFYRPSEQNLAKKIGQELLRTALTMGSTKPKVPPLIYRRQFKAAR